jgi:hypothetical protein
MKQQLLIAGLLAAMVSGAQAITPIPKESGFSGFINLGVASGQVESNTVAKVAGADLGKDGINNIGGSANAENVVLPVAAGEVSYTFASTGTQLFLGTLLEDFVRFDSSTRGGVRQSMGGVGVASFSLLTTPITGAKTWNDPFITRDQGKRTTTDREAHGVRIAWDRIFGTGLEIRYSWRDQHVDNDRIGESLVGATGPYGITAREQRDLLRDGDLTSTEALYAFKLSEGSILVLTARYNENQLDGDALSYDGFAGEVNWAKKSGHWRFVTNVSYGQYEAKGVNPIYDENGDFYRAGGSFTVFYAEPFGLKHWNANGGVIYFEENNDIDFLDQKVAIAQLGMMYRF